MKKVDPNEKKGLFNPLSYDVEKKILDDNNVPFMLKIPSGEAIYLIKWQYELMKKHLSDIIMNEQELWKDTTNGRDKALKQIEV